MATAAFLDESIRGSLYVLAAVMVPAHDPHCRREVLRLRLPGQRRIHWRDESSVRRDRIVDAVVVLPWTGVAIAFHPARRRLQSAARAACLRGIVAWLSGQGVSRLVIESRGEHNDRHDRRSIIECRRSGHVVETYGFARPAEEPLLWIADIVAGATSAHLAGLNGRWFHAIREKVEVLPRLAP